MRGRGVPLPGTPLTIVPAFLVPTGRNGALKSPGKSVKDIYGARTDLYTRVLSVSCSAASDGTENSS